MNREEYMAKLKGLHPQMDCDLEWKYTQEYIASLEARIAELEKLAVVWEKCESREQIDHSRRYCVICDRGELWICYLPAPPEEK